MQKESEVETRRERVVGSSQSGLEVYGGWGVGKGEKVFIKKWRVNGKVTGRKKHRGSPLNPTGVLQHQ